jgi:hypothetical protein
VSVDLASARRFVPYDLRRVGRRLVLDWIDLGRSAFVDPFFRETILRRMRREPRPRCVRTDAAELRTWRAGGPALAPAGFVFHVSRCGSTLLSRMLAASPRHLVLSEPDPVNSLLLDSVRNRRPELPLRSLIGALARPRRGSERHLFVKFSSWNLFHEATIARAFPATPRVFVYRNPIEVLVSVLRSPPGWLLAKDDPAAAAHLLGDAWPARRIAAMTVPEYAARVLRELYSAPLRRRGARTLLVNHEQIDASLLARVLRHFGVRPDPEHLGRAAGLLRYDAKSGRRERRYRPDSESKRRAAPGELVALAERWLRRPYEELERRRSLC